MTDRLIVFVKEPRAGHVKTRLATLLGPELAASLYRSLVEHVLRATADPGVERLVLGTPAHGLDAIRAWLPGESCRAQEGDDLGERMSRAFDAAFAEGARRAVVVGSDIPGLTRANVRRALDALEGADVAIAPAGDGGYSMLALEARQPQLFTGIAWSTERVLDQTLRAAAGLEVAVLDTLPDLDTPDDLRRAWPALGPSLPPDLRAQVGAHL